MDGGADASEDIVRIEKFYYPATCVLHSGTMASAAIPVPIRAIRRVGLTAIAINGMVGAGIFGLPANVAQLLGPSSLLAYLLAGGAVLLVALCFAEAGSQFESSGGPYLYAREAFGPFAGFQAGMLLTLSRVAGAAAISNAFSAYLGFLWPAVTQGAGRALAITMVLAILTWINCLGIRPGVRTINILTCGKLIPLVVFCAVGLFYADPRAVSFSLPAEPGTLKQATLLLIYAFGGFEFAAIPSEEVVDPKRTLPAVLTASVAFVVLLYLSIQWVAMGTLPDLASSATPLASSARTFLGPAGGILLVVGALFSTTGTNSSAILIGSRMLYALSRGGLLPEVMGRLHPRYRTPVFSTFLFAAAAWAAAVAGTFGQLAALGAVSRVLYYTTTCLAVPFLRRKLPREQRRFELLGGWTIPALALAVCLWLLSGSTREQALIAGATMLAGALLYRVFAKPIL